MVFHYYGWSGLQANPFSHEFIYRTGIYAVLMFYVISGISFGYVYNKMSMDRASLGSFWIKRFFRLAPLYWLGIVMTLLPSFYSSKPFPSISDIVLNVSVTFGAIDPGAYIVTGGWSIGNEMAYYIIFPLLLLAIRRSFTTFALVLAGSVILGGFYAYDWLSPTQTLAEQWNTYIHPGSHLFYFVAGVGLSWPLLRSITVPVRVGIGLSLALLLAFALLPHGPSPVDNISIVTGWRWAAYSAVCIALVGTLALTPTNLANWLHVPLSWLGRVSYAVYLMHPIVYRLSEPVLAALGISIPTYVVAAPLTLIFSEMTFRFLEKPLIDRGRSLARRYSEWATKRAQTPKTENVPPQQW